MELTPELKTLGDLMLALALGLLLGAERGWRQREKREGERVAGLRTFGLVSLLGGMAAYLSKLSSAWVLAAAFLSVAAIAAQAYRRTAKETSDRGVTTLISLLLAFALGAAVLYGQAVIAAPVAVVAALLLSLKSRLHRWLERFEERELQATLRLALISVAVLPVLPNRDFGPYQALNVYEMWWMVVLITAISYAGYFAMKAMGTDAGALATGLVGGLASSTAVTLNLSKLGRHSPGDKALQAGILAACATMFPRMLVVLAIAAPPIFTRLFWPLAVAGAVTYGGGAWLWRLRSRGDEDDSPETAIDNPFQIRAALFFGAILTVISLAAAWLKEAVGDWGLFALAAASGVTDVDAITLSVARMDVELFTGSIAIALAATVNSQVKGLMAISVGGWRFGWRLWSVLTLAGAVAIAIPLIFAYPSGA